MNPTRIAAMHPIAQLGGWRWTKGLLIALACTSALAVAQESGECTGSCADAAGTCVTVREQERDIALAACTGSRPAVKRCQKAAKRRFKKAKKACKGPERRACKRCCKQGGTAEQCATVPTLPGGTTTTTPTNGSSTTSTTLPVGPPLVGTTSLVSINSTGTGGTSVSPFPGISANGRFVVFTSLAANLVPNFTDNNSLLQGADVYVRDVQTGTTSLVSVNYAGTGSGNANSHFNGAETITISADGRFVAFMSAASDLVAPGVDTNGLEDVFVRDLQTGTTVLASMNLAGTASGNGASSIPKISADGRIVVFISRATNLVALDDANDANSDVFARDLQTGVTTLVSVNMAGTASGIAPSGGAWPSLVYPQSVSADGRFVAFHTGAVDLLPQHLYNSGIVVRDLQAGTTRSLTVNYDGAGASGGQEPQISADGRFVAFASTSGLLTPPGVDLNGAMDVFVRDLQTETTTLVSVNLFGRSAGSDQFSNLIGVSAANPLISSSGRFVAFVSSADDLVDPALDTNDANDVFLRDLVAGTTAFVSVNSSGIARYSAFPLRPSADGQFVPFFTNASDIVAGLTDQNGEYDLFIRDMRRGTNTLVSINASGTGSSNGYTDIGAVSDDGRAVAFYSTATDLVSSPPVSGPQLYRWGP